MKIPQTIEKIIEEFDQGGGKLCEHTVQAALIGARSKLEEQLPSNDAWADLAAFTFQTGQQDWLPLYTYFGPLISGTSEDGTPYYSPDPRDLTEDIILHWESRAESLVHPVLKARYSDLVWDLTRHVTDKRPSVHFASLAIDNYVESVNSKSNPDIHEDSRSAIRALQLSTLIKDDKKIANARDLVLSLFYNEAVCGGFWFDLCDALIAHKRPKLNDDEANDIIAKLEAFVTVYTTEITFDAFAAQVVSDRLIRIYSARRDPDSVKRISLIISEAYEKKARNGSRMQAMAWLQTACDFARQARDEERYDRLKVERENAIRDSSSEMKVVSHRRSIKLEEVEAFLEEVIDAHNSIQTLYNIANQFIVSKKQLSYQADQGAKSSLFFSVFTTSIIAEDHVAAEIGGENDEEGQLYRYATFARLGNLLFLSQALEAAVERHSLTAEEIAAAMQRNSLFSEFPLLVAGVQAWMQSDYVKCLFVLVPQIEDAFRNLARNLGQPVTKDKRGLKRWEVSQNLGDFLSKDAVKAEVGEDIVFWIKSIFSDPRGLNLRNRVAHGLASREIATYDNCEIVIHAMLVLGFYKEIAASCANRDVLKLDEGAPAPAEALAAKEPGRKRRRRRN